MSRKLLGIIAAALLLVGCIAAVNGPGGSTASGFAGGCIRVGLVLGALWLALPQIQSLLAHAPRWILGWFIGQRGNKQQPSGTNAQKIEAKPVRPRRRSG
jgi:hypothetical protein